MTTDLSVPAIFEALRESKRFKHIIGTAFPSLAVSSSIPESSSSPSPTLRTLNQRTLTHSPIIPRTPPTLSDSQAHVLIRTGNLMNAEFQVPMSIIGLSKTLLHILKCSSLFLEYHEKCIRLPSIESNTFQCILEYFMNGNSKAWEPPDEQILEIAEAAFYLNFPQIVDVCVQRGVTLFNYIETLDGLSTSVLHIFLKQLSIKQLLYAEKKLISKEQHFDMKPYWLSHLYKHATPLHALESCFQWTTDSIRDYLHPPISLPLFVSSSHISSVKLNSRRRYFIPKENLSDTVIRFYRDIFEQCSFHVHLKLKQCEEVKFPMFSFSNLKENPKETKHKYVRMKPDASMTIGETSDQGKKPERNDYVEVTSLNPEVFLVDAPLVEIHGVHLSFPTKLQGSLLSSWPITHLTLEDCVLSNAQFSNFCHWIQFKSHLKSVSIHRCFEACQLSGFFQSLGFHPSLAKIELSPIPKKEETFDKSVLKGMTSLPTISNLKQLHLQHFLFLPSCLRGVLDMIQLCHLHLVHLQLSHLRVGTQVTHLLQVTWPHLTHLNFEDTSLPPSTLLVFLAHLTTSFPKLVHLNLSHNTFTASILEHLCSILPQTCLKEFLFNLRTPVTMEDILYVRLFSQGLPDSLTFLALENHDLPWPDLLAFISTRSLYLHCSLDKKYRRELKKIIKQSTFPIMIWCDTILTNISLHK
ncbi:hypothetical protein HMI54_015076 [Coelomomyces lativittatus]|nr:hypothetical protein HMI54_015076 [Coelomomyces lativittatus]